MESNTAVAKNIIFKVLTITTSTKKAKPLLSILINTKKDQKNKEACSKVCEEKKTPEVTLNNKITTATKAHKKNSHSKIICTCMFL